MRKREREREGERERERERERKKERKEEGGRKNETHEGLYSHLINYSLSKKKFA